MRNIFYVGILAVLLAISGCSTQKNTFVSRSYHSLVSHYNIYFNGKESYKKGVNRVEEQFKNDYNAILPVFTYSDKILLESVASEMDVALKKASKVISLHSIRAKPNFKNNRLSPSEKEFMAKSEYNSWVDESYMLLVKANFYKQDYDDATKAITLIQKDFAKEPVKYEALIWQARIAIESNELAEAEKILTTLESDKKFPKHLRTDLNTTYADVLIRKQQYKPAAQKLTKALETVHGKIYKVRYTYILAQLYQQLKEYRQAIALYEKVTKMNPPYEMTFNARINLAGLVDANEKGGKEIKAKLYKMLKDDKNNEYRDQIYFALANLEMKEGNDEKAIELYKKSVSFTTKNDQQKAFTYLTLADYYYGKKEYIPSQAYYDSCLTGIRPDNPEIDRIKARASNLTKLVTNLNTIYREDSLQRVAKMSEPQRMALISKIINDLREKEAIEQQKEMQRSQDLYALNTRKPNMNAQGTAGNWYFYNPVSVQQGVNEFQTRWGKRRLEDNWRRRNKGLLNPAESPETAKEDNKPAQEKKVVDTKSPAFYLQDLPVTDSLVKVSNTKIKESYYAAANVYREDLKETGEAIKLYEQLVAKFPASDLTLPAYYQLYSSYNEMGNASKAASYKQLILSRYPESIYAKVLTDPNYARNMDQKGNEEKAFYEKTYNLFNEGAYQQVIQNADVALNQYKNQELLSRFALLKAMSTGKTSDITSYRRELEKVIANYPKTDVSASAKEMLSYVDKLNPEVQKSEESIKAEATYNPDDNSPLLLAWVVASNEDINQLVFDVINFNLDNFNKIKFEVQNADLTKEQKIITIHTLPSKEVAVNYYEAFMKSAGISKNLKDKKIMAFIISKANLATLQNDRNVSTYLRFFEKHFLSKP